MCTLNEVREGSLRQGNKRRNYVYLGDQFVAKFATSELASTFVEEFGKKASREEDSADSSLANSREKDFATTSEGVGLKAPEPCNETPLERKRRKDRERKRAKREQERALREQ